MAKWGTANYVWIPCLTLFYSQCLNQGLRDSFCNIQHSAALHHVASLYMEAIESQHGHYPSSDLIQSASKERDSMAYIQCTVWWKDCPASSSDEESRLHHVTLTMDTSLTWLLTEHTQAHRHTHMHKGQAIKIPKCHPLCSWRLCYYGNYVTQISVRECCLHPGAATLQRSIRHDSGNVKNQAQRHLFLQKNKVCNI